MKIQVKRKGRNLVVTGACVDIEYTVLGPIANNTFVISDGDFTFVVDPSHDADAILKMVGNRNVDAIVVTHHHADHTSALKALKDKTGAPVYASAIDTPVIENQPKDFPPAESCKVDVQLKDKDTVKLGNMAWKVIATPGHTPRRNLFIPRCRKGQISRWCQCADFRRYAFLRFDWKNRF